jgi:hypothetical protein
MANDLTLTPLTFNLANLTGDPIPIILYEEDIGAFILKQSPSEKYKGGTVFELEDDHVKFIMVRSIILNDNRGYTMSKIVLPDGKMHIFVDTSYPYDKQIKRAHFVA